MSGIEPARSHLRPYVTILTSRPMWVGGGGGGVGIHLAHFVDTLFETDQNANRMHAFLDFSKRKHNAHYFWDKIRTQIQCIFVFIPITARNRSVCSFCDTSRSERKHNTYFFRHIQYNHVNTIHILFEMDWSQRVHFFSRHYETWRQILLLKKAIQQTQNLLQTTNMLLKQKRAHNNIQTLVMGWRKHRCVLCAFSRFAIFVGSYDQN